MAIKAGPKSRDLAKLPDKTGSALEWIEMVTGELYPWQQKDFRALIQFKRPRLGYIQVARKNGKSRLAAALMIAEACLKDQRHIYAISDSERNLNSVIMREIREMVSSSPYLCDSVHIYKTHFEVPQTGSFIEARPNNFRASQGINPHLVVFDEVHLQHDFDTWSGMQMAGAAREDALLLGITTPGYNMNSVAHNLYQQCKAGSSSANLYSAIYEPSNPNCAPDDRNAWKEANPCYNHLPNWEQVLQSDYESLPEHEFRRFRLGLWTATAEAWLPHGAWDACLATRVGEPPPGTPIYLGFDGSFSGDSTALVGCTAVADSVPFVFVVGCWENPGLTGWRVPRDEVEAAVHRAFNTWQVKEMLCDPPYWGREISEWMQRYGTKRVLEFPTFSRARMAPACTTFYSGVMENGISHSGDARLARHINNAVVKSSPQGDFITKQDKDSPAKIDLAVAAVLAYSGAAPAQAKPKAELFIG